MFRLDLLCFRVVILLVFFNASSVYGVSVWKNHYYYRAGSLVIQQDGDNDHRKYRAIKPSKNKKPSEHTEYWKLVSIIHSSYQITESDEDITPGLIDAPASYPEDNILPTYQFDANTNDLVLPDLDVKASSIIPGSSNNIPTTSSFDEQQEKVIQNSGEWDASVFYLEGELTQYNGNAYQARWSNSGMIPGKTDAWVISNAVGVHHDWQPDHIYPVAGLRVHYENHIYESLGWSLNDEPKYSSIWFKVGSDYTSHAEHAQWDSNIEYMSGELVMYKDYIFRSRWTNSNQEPGKSDVWIIVYEDNKKYHWHPEFVYPLFGNYVTHNDKRYVNSAWTLGEEPGISSVWTYIGESDIIKDWDANTKYEMDDLVKYSQRYYVSLKQNLNEKPGQTDSWSLSNHDGTVYQWIREHTYPVAGVEVSYLNKIYRNSRWTRGDIPGQETHNIWHVVSGDDSSDTDTSDGSSGDTSGGSSGDTQVVNSIVCQSPVDHSLQLWSQNKSYLQNETVQHTVQLDGVNYTLSWQSRWSINLGEEPGFNNGWVLLLDDASACPWSEYYTYSDADAWNKVIHKGKLYIRRFWTFNDEPGAQENNSPWELIQ